MSWQAVKAVLDAHIPDRNARRDVDNRARYGCSGHVMKLVLLSMADRADEHGYGAHPGIRELARRAQVHTDTVQIALAHLSIDGLIRCADPGTNRRSGRWNLDLEVIHRCAGEPRALENRHPRAERGSDPRAERGSGPAQDSIRHTTLEADASVSTISGQCIACGEPVPRTRFRCKDGCNTQENTG